MESGEASLLMITTIISQQHAAQTDPSLRFTCNRSFSSFLHTWALGFDERSLWKAYVQHTHAEFILWIEASKRGFETEVFQATLNQSLGFEAAATMNQSLGFEAAATMNQSLGFEVAVTLKQSLGFEAAVTLKQS